MKRLLSASNDFVQQLRELVSEDLLMDVFRRRQQPEIDGKTLTVDGAR